MGRRIVIVGGVAGGATAAARLRRLDEFAEIVILERGPYVSFANCGLPYVIGGDIAQRDKLLVQTPARLNTIMNLDVRVRHEVTRIDSAGRQVEVNDLTAGTVCHLRYDELILAPGAAPVKPPIPGIDRAGHFTLRNIPDLEQVTNWIDERKAKRAVVGGGGFIGLEVAEQLQRRGLRVTVVEALPQVMTPFDPEMAGWLHAELRKNDIDVRLNAGVTGFIAASDAGASRVELKNGDSLPADVVILALGVRPEIGLAKTAGLEIGGLGGIRVDSRMRTNVPHIWAVGDAVEVRDPVTGQWTLIPLAGPANRQGRIAADNICGIMSEYRGTFGTAIVRVFGLTAASTGANEKTLARLGIPFRVVHLHPGSHASYYPGAHPLAMKILFAPDSGKLLGAQIVGPEGVDKRIDVLATALQSGLTVHDLAELELAYAPMFGSAKDPVNLAGMVAQNVLAETVKIAQWNEVTETSALVLDVREKKEREGGFIPGSVHIPLGELRGRLSELPRNGEILVYCQSGQRSYNACRILMQQGYRCRNLTGSFRTWRAASA